MANLQLPFGIEVLNQKPADAKYFLSGETVYNSVVEVNDNVPIGIRHVGLTVNILSVEYWYETGIDDIDLVIKGGAGNLVNVGDGSGEVFSGSSGSSSYLRTIKGSGTTTVETINDTIIIHSSSNVRDVEVTPTGQPYNATTESDYISVQGAVDEIYLPLTPSEGHQITISDDDGNSGTFPIAIIGGGILIDDSLTASIDSNYGSITILYNGTFWKVISFSN